MSTKKRKRSSNEKSTASKRRAKPLPAADKVDLESADLENMTIKQILTETTGGKKTKAQIARDDEKQRKLQQVKLERTVLKKKGAFKQSSNSDSFLTEQPESNLELTEEEELRRIEAESQRELEERERESQTVAPEDEQQEIDEEDATGAGGAAGKEVYWEEWNEEAVEGEAAQAEGAQEGVEGTEEGFDLALSELADEEEVAGGQPRVKLVNGKMVIDNDSLYTLAAPQEALVKVHTSAKKLFTGVKKYTRDKWTEEDTDLFYQVIRMCGSDFTMIQAFFPQKTRTQIRNKYKREEKDNPKLLDWCFRNSIPLDIELFKQKTGYVEPEETPEAQLKTDSSLLSLPEYQPVVNHYKNDEPTDKIEEPFEEDDEDDYNRPDGDVQNIEIKDEDHPPPQEEDNEPYYAKEDFPEEGNEQQYDNPEFDLDTPEDTKKVTPPNDGDEDFSFSLLT